ncbi:MAG TPA: hypothetical protein VGF40_05045 [Thermoanaerobaculia bacterium]
MKKIALLVFATITAAAGPLAAAAVKQQIKASPGETLRVNLQNGSIAVSGSDEDAVTVVATVEGRDADAGIAVRRFAGGVEIAQDPARRHGHGRATVKVTVPRKFDLDIETMGGSIAVDDVHGSLSGRTMGGELLLTRVAGRLAMSTNGGNVLLRDASADGSVQTMGGNVLFENVRGGVKGSSMGGNVVYRNVARADGAATGKAFVVSTMGGQIDVADAPHGAEVETMGGDITIGRANRFVKARTMGGSIEIGAVDGWLEAGTMGGDIEASMTGNPNEGDRHVTLESKGGNIALVLPAGLDADFDVQILVTKNSKRNYAIESDFPVQISASPDWSYGKGAPHRMIEGRGRSGSGKHKVTIRTVNGDVKISKR